MMPHRDGKTGHMIRCFGCCSVVCRRASRSVLLSNVQIKVYSTDTPTGYVRCTRDSYMAYSCKCTVIDVECKCCRMILGYHILHPCGSCMTGWSSGHRWIFDTSSVISTPKKASLKDGLNGSTTHHDQGDGEVKIR
ncbi:hypothetical protein [Encephalitozoon cuniculi GB-M1]|uniref:Protein FAM72 n=2 Tax=Encephalitozoon cuniculi TaxID=6035 RepID=Q8SUX2_ENCCU|nr:uncharacterized protein ECU07_1310 [Encephalitozoon cuniculi GB-M1]AGE95891.1 hypothetical protein ECU07_1310 [Encephalitozoon cuniculi]UYI27295.1 putative kinetochore protein MIS18 [Encephalitozoon cuniculi]CAD25664.1 hypothetical protein [Encephalitozoon cuniculi GB-M1]